MLCANTDQLHIIWVQLELCQEVMAELAGRASWIQRPEVRIPGHDFFDVELQVGDSEYVEYGVCVSFGI